MNTFVLLTRQFLLNHLTCFTLTKMAIKYAFARRTNHDFISLLTVQIAPTTVLSCYKCRQLQFVEHDSSHLYAFEFTSYSAWQNGNHHHNETINLRPFPFFRSRVLVITPVLCTRQKHNHKLTFRVSWKTYKADTAFCYSDTSPK